MNTPREFVELFHLLFLEQLSRNLDIQLYAIKGGCNLRFFCKSQRYSEDLDIDVQTIAVNTLKNKIDKLLKSAPFQKILKTNNITISHISTPKQTNTTQRWKLTLETNAPLPLNTKIEFSRRRMNGHMIYEPIDPEIIQHYHLMPIFCSHYDKKNAFLQKVEALAGRPETQARDIFDLFLLISTGDVVSNNNTIDNHYIEQAQHNALTVSFADFKSQVIAFLTPNYQKQYDSKNLWENIVTSVINQLESLKS